MSELYNWNVYSTSVNFISGIIWIPYTMFLFYLFWEHHKREKFPQNLIMLLLAIGAIFRTVWFLGYRMYQSALGFLIINRIAILLQFTALSVLILMWMRALKITRIAYSKQPSSMLSATSSFNANQTNGGTQNISSNGSTNSLRLSGSAKDKDSNVISPLRLSNSALQRQISQTPSSRQALMFKQVEAQFQLLVRYVAVFVAVVWLCILLSLIGDADREKSDSRHFFNANIIMISSLCLLEAVFTLVVGFRTALALQKELAPVFVSNTVTHNNLSHSQHHSKHLLSSVTLRNTNLNGSASNTNNAGGLKQSGSNQDLHSAGLSGGHHHHDERLLSQSSEVGDWYSIWCCCFTAPVFLCTSFLDCCGFQSFVNLYRLFFTRSQSALGLQLQRDVLRSLLTVSLIVFVFFFLRAFGYLYRFIDTPTTPSKVHDAIGEVWYPLFFYQIPELIPTLAIAAGISPPNGILKRMLSACYAFFCCATVSNNNGLSSVFSSDGSTSTSLNRRTRGPSRRQQNVSVASSNTFLSSLTGGGMSVQSGHSAVDPSAAQLSQQSHSQHQGQHVLGTIAEHQEIKAGAPHHLATQSSSMATSEQSGVSEDHLMMQAGSLQQHLQLPLHLQQQLHIAQLQHQHQQLYQYQQQQQIQHQQHLLPSDMLQNAVAIAGEDDEEARDSELSMQTMMMGRMSDAQSRHSQQMRTPSTVSEAQQQQQQHHHHSNVTKSSFSIASSPMTTASGANMANANNINSVFRASNAQTGIAGTGADVLIDDVVSNPDDAEEGERKQADRAIAGSQNTQQSGSYVVWSPLTGSAASSYQPSSQQSRTLSNFSSSRQQPAHGRNRGGNPPSTSLSQSQSQSQSQQRVGLISMLFHRSSSAAQQSQRPQPLSASPAVSSLASSFPRQYYDSQQADGDHEQARQDSVDYAEMLYRLNSYIPERLLSSDALYHDFDDALLPSTYVGPGEGADGGMITESAEREHALAAYLAPKSSLVHSHWSRQQYPSTPAAAAAGDPQGEGAGGEEGSFPPVVSAEDASFQPQLMEEQYAEIQEGAVDNLEGQQRPGKQSALSKSWLNKVLR